MFATTQRAHHTALAMTGQAPTHGLDTGAVATSVAV